MSSFRLRPFIWSFCLHKWRGHEIFYWHGDIMEIIQFLTSPPLFKVASSSFIFLTSQASKWYMMRNVIIRVQVHLQNAASAAVLIYKWFTVSAIAFEVCLHYYFVGVIRIRVTRCPHTHSFAIANKHVIFKITENSNITFARASHYWLEDV
jgi:hypothetical protein